MTPRVGYHETFILGKRMERSMDSRADVRDAIVGLEAWLNRLIAMRAGNDLGFC